MSYRELSKEEQQELGQEQRSYARGLGLSLILTLLPFGLAAFTATPHLTLWWIIGLCALVQIVVHLRFFLHITLAKNKREDLQLILFTILILTLLCGGTLWILFDLYYRMMPNMMP